MSPNPESFLSHLRAEGYHPRSNKHSNALAVAIVNDLLQYCPKLASKAAAGQIVYDLNFTIISGTAEWNVDLVLGTAPPNTLPPVLPARIVQTHPVLVQVAIEIKTVMTEHRKAVKNRKRDFDAHHAHVHLYNQNAIAGGVIVINASDQFRSPLRQEDTVHHNPQKLVTHCINEIRSITSSGGIIGSPGLDAKAVIVVDLNNITILETSYVISKPAPSVGDPVHYDSFIQTVCDLYTARFA
jgi:hypothetical protein